MSSRTLKTADGRSSVHAILIEFSSARRARNSLVVDAIAHYRAAHQKLEFISSAEPAPGALERDRWEREQVDACVESSEALRYSLSMQPHTAAEAIALIDCYTGRSTRVTVTKASCCSTTCGPF
jgi:hypothetical protein